MLRQEIYSIFKEELLKSIEQMNPQGKEVKILICGQSGSGKRTLLKNLFGISIPKDTQTRNEYFLVKSVKIRLLDIEKSDKLDEKIFDDEIDLIWYCARSSHLISSDWYFAVLDYLSHYAPAALVIPLKKGLFFKKHVKKLATVLDRFSTSDFFILSDDEVTGIQNLLNWSIEELSSGMDEELLASSDSKSILKMKRDLIAQKIIPSYTSGAGVIGAVPIPFSDAILLIPEQVAMTIHILKIYGLEQSAKVITGIISSTFLSQIGRITSGALLKILPGGIVFGTVVNGSVAASFTWCLGMAINEICYQYLESGEDVSFEEFFHIDKLKTQIEKIGK